MLVALVILGTAGLAVMAGLQLSIKASDIHRKQSSAGAFVRNYAEKIQDYVEAADSHYDACGGGVDYSPATVGFTVPAGYDATVDSVVPLAGDGATLACASDAGVQRVKLIVNSEGTHNRTTEELIIIVRRSCDPSAPC
nr:MULTISPECIES: type II secretion system protein [unclassified Nocardioides]